MAELVTTYSRSVLNDAVLTDKLKLKGTEEELRELALAALQAIDEGKAVLEFDGVPIKFKLIH